MSWMTEAFFYHIYPLGFCGAPPHNDFCSLPVPRLRKVLDWVAHMKRLGVTAVYFGPLFEAVSHGYDTVDYLQVDRRLGERETFRQVVQELHAQGIRVVVDGVFHHVGRAFFAFRDLQEKGSQSSYLSWFCGINFNAASPCGDSFSYEGWEGHCNLVKLNLRQQAVKDYLFAAVKDWIDYYDIDGIRLDVAYCLDTDFMRELVALCRSRKPDFWLMGEMIHGDYKRLVQTGLLDSATNYECYKGLYSCHNDANYFEIAYSLNRQFGEEYGIYQELLLYNFVDNHDVTRIGSVIDKPGYLYPLHALLFTMPGIPSVYYGSEWGIEGKKAMGSDAPLRPSLELDKVSCCAPNKDLAVAIASLAKIRKEHRALQAGGYRQVLVKHQQYAFLRYTEEEQILVIVNAAAVVVDVSFDLPVSCSRLVDLLNQSETFVVRNHNVRVAVPSCWARICKVEP